MISISKLEQNWNIDLNGDGVVEQARNRRQSGGQTPMQEATQALSQFWDELDDFFDSEELLFDEHDEAFAIPSNLSFPLFGNDEGLLIFE